MTTLAYEPRDGVATITLNRPDQLNAYTKRMAQELVAAIDRTDADDDVRAIIVTGAGRAFCAGADLSAGAATFAPAAVSAFAVARPSPDAAPVMTADKPLTSIFCSSHFAKIR